MKINYLFLSLLVLLTTWYYAQQPMLQVLPCGTTSTHITIQPVGIQTTNWSGMIPNLSDPSQSVSSLAVYVNDGVGDGLDGCEPILNSAAINGKIAFINRGTCGFGFKALAAQNAGAIAVVIVNNVPGSPIGMDGGSEGISVTIPVIMVGIEQANLLFTHPTCTFFIGSYDIQNNDIKLNGAYAGYNGRSYTQIPNVQAFGNTFSFGGTLMNNGVMDQTNAKLQVYQGAALVSQSAPVPNMLPSSQIAVTCPPAIAISSTIGTTYNFNFKAVSDEIDGIIFNNEDNQMVTITDDIMAKDEYVTGGFAGQLTAVTQFTTIFDITATQKLYALDIKPILNSSTIGQSIFIELYDENFNVINSASYIISSSDIGLDMVSVPLDAGSQILTLGTYYLSAYIDAPILGSGFCPSTSAFIGSPFDQPGATLNYTPIIRLNFDCQVFPNEGAYNMNFVNLTKTCNNLCDGLVTINHLGSDEIRVFDENISLIQTINNPLTSGILIENLCPGSYKAVGTKFCYGNISDTLEFTIEEKIVSTIVSQNTSTCTENDGSLELTLLNQNGFFTGNPYNFTLNWTGPVSGSTNINGTIVNFGSINSTVNGNFTIGNYTLTATENPSGCQHTTTFTVGNDIPTQDVCVVTVDEVTGNHNVIAWERPADDSHIEEFKVYREITTGNYQVIGTVDVANLTLYEDFTANPNTTGYKYKVTQVDVCGGESELGNFHNTIHLQYLGGGNFQWSQYSIENQPNPVASYNVYRDDNGTGNFQILPNGVVTGTQSTFTDVNYASFPNAVYVVDVVWISTTGCTATKANINTSRSNTKTINDGGTGSGIIETLSSLVNVAPNPANTIVSIKVPEVLIGSTIRITNSLGQTFSVDTINTTDLNVDLNSFANGVYFIQIETTEGRITKKLVKN